MPEGFHKCKAGCGKTITWRFAICSDCEKKYGKSAKEWPDWLRYRWNEEQRKRRRDAREREMTIPLIEED